MNLISEATALDQLQEKWRFNRDRAYRILEIARRVGPNSEPVTGGLITITYRKQSQHRLERLYTIEDFTGPRVARQRPVRYSKTTSSDPLIQERRPKMPPAKTKAARTAPAPAPEPEVAEVTAPDLTVYLDKPLSPTMGDYCDWFVDTFGEGTLTELSWDRLVVLGSQMYPHFQKSDLNISRKAERKAQRDAAVAANGDAEEAEAPAAPARKASAPARRGRKPAAPATAAY